MTDDRGQTTEGSLFRATEPQNLRASESQRSEIRDQRAAVQGSKFPSSKFKVRKRYGLKVSV